VEVLELSDDLTDIKGDKDSKTGKFTDNLKERTVFSSILSSAHIGQFSLATLGNKFFLPQSNGISECYFGTSNLSCEDNELFFQDILSFGSSLITKSPVLWPEGDNKAVLYLNQSGDYLIHRPGKPSKDAVSYANFGGTRKGAVVIQSKSKDGDDIFLAFGGSKKVLSLGVDDTKWQDGDESDSWNRSYATGVANQVAGGLDKDNKTTAFFAYTDSEGKLTEIKEGEKPSGLGVSSANSTGGISFFFGGFAVDKQKNNKDAFIFSNN